MPFFFLLSFFSLLSCADGGVGTARYHVVRALALYRHYLEKAKAKRNAIAALQGNHRTYRLDIIAYNKVKTANMIVNAELHVGDVPGVEVGDAFTYRHQMAVVGLHRHPFVGIEFRIPLPNKIPTATAIVMMTKTSYADDQDFGNLIVYTGKVKFSVVG